MVKYEASVDGGRREWVHRAPRVTDAKRPTLAITIDAAGRRIVGGNPLDESTLEGLLKLSFDDDHGTSVVIKTMPGAPQRAATELVERARGIGFVHVSVVAGD
jgi:hypothetical protein